MSGTEGVMAVSIEEWNAKNAEIERLRAALQATVGVFEGHDDVPLYVRKARAALEPKP